MTFPSFSVGEVLRAQDMNAVGLWLVKSQTIGTGVSSVTVTGAFSADYDNYKIQYVGGTGTGSSVLQFNYVGTNGATGFYGNLIYASFAGGVPALNSVGYNNTGAITHAGGNSNGRWNMNLEIQGPFLTAVSFLSSNYADGSNAGSTTGFHFHANSYSAFVLTPTVGTLTGGTVYVYGYKK
jgi:hypothetical protein